MHFYRPTTNPLVITVTQIISTHLIVGYSDILMSAHGRIAARSNFPPYFPRRSHMPPLSSQEIQSRLVNIPDWQLESGELVRTFLFKDFRASLAFVNNVGDVAENAGHHPDIDIRYNKVRLALVTHDAGGITQKDFDLAAAADKIC